MATPAKTSNPAGAELVLFDTPARSLLKTGGPARRVVDHSVQKAEHAELLRSGLEHFSLFERVQALEAEREALRQHVRELRAEKQELAEQLQHAVSNEQHYAAASRLEGSGAGDGTDEGADLQARIEALKQELAAEQRERRKAHNALVDLRGNIRVYCRVKPVLLPDGQPGALRMLADKRSLAASVNGQDHSFTFNQVFGPSATQSQVFAEVSELVQSSLDGYSVCVMAYGQTGAGKTHTMTGGGSPEAKGLVPRTLEKIMESIQRLQLQDWAYTLELSIMEVYNDRIRDLLEPGGREVTDMNAIKHGGEQGGGQVSVSGVSTAPIQGVDQALQLIARAAANRSSHATAMNASSSRSHSVFMLSLTGRHKPSDTTLLGSLAMVDLAGSERLVRSQAEGQRKVEACAINQSLSSLCDVFEALSSKSKHVPYRNSKLTYLLKPCLSAGGKALLLLHVSPDSPYESLTSLRFGTKVAGVEVGPAQRRIESSLMLGEPGSGPFIRDLPSSSSAALRPPQAAGRTDVGVRTRAAAAGNAGRAASGGGPLQKHRQAGSVPAQQAGEVRGAGGGARSARQDSMEEEQAEGVERAGGAARVADGVDLRGHFKRKQVPDGEEDKEQQQLGDAKRQKAAWH